MSRTNFKLICLALSHCGVARNLPTILYCLFVASLLTIYITTLLNMWGKLLIDLYNWIRYTQTIVVINWQPCTGPGQLCLPWHENFPLGRKIDPVKTCVDYFKKLPIHTQFKCTLADPPKSYVNIQVLLHIPTLITNPYHPVD